MAIPDEAIALDPTAFARAFRLDLANGERASARGGDRERRRYRRPAIECLAAFESTSVHYWASPLERSNDTSFPA
jgi:thioredoxin reductase (NADPH)